MCTFWVYLIVNLWPFSAFVELFIPFIPRSESTLKIHILGILAKHVLKRLPSHHQHQPILFKYIYKYTSFSNISTIRNLPVVQHYSLLIIIINVINILIFVFVAQQTLLLSVSSICAMCVRMGRCSLSSHV